MKHVEEENDQPKMKTCDFCNYETISEINLEKHEKDIHRISKKQSNHDESKKASDKKKNKEGYATERAQGSNFPCDVCGFFARNDNDLNRHLENKHSFTRVNKRSGFSKEERRSNGICVFWTKGKCHFQDLCRFSHEESPQSSQSPQCHFDGFCINSSCRFSHLKANPNTSGSAPFLERRSFRRNPHLGQRGQTRGTQWGQGQRR